MKVLLIQPPSIEKRTIGPPIGLGYLASYLESKGHSIKIIESIILRYRNDNIKKEIKHFDPDILGISTVTQCNDNALSLVDFAKNNNSNCSTILGGIHPSINAKEILKNSKNLDIIVRGEGEITINELLEKLTKNDISNVYGISFKENGRIKENKNRNFIENLDKLPFPAYHLFALEKYKIKEKFFEIGLYGKQGQQYGTILTSRGCPYDCLFCSPNSLWKNKWRPRSPENIIQELQLLRYKYNKKIIDFLDDVFTFDKKRVLKICKLIKKEGIDISWMCTTRVDLIDQEIVNSLKKAGCTTIFFGIESGNQQILNYLNKSFKLNTIKRAVKIAKEADLNVMGSFILGIPGETGEMINKTINFAKKLELKSARFPLLIPFPGTKMYKLAQENNYLSIQNWNNYNYSNSVMNIPQIKSRALKKYQIKASIFSNLKPEVFYRIIKGIIP